MFTFISERDFQLENPKSSTTSLDFYDTVLCNKVICLDPGHGGKERANIGFSGKYVEPDGVLDIALRLEKHLLESGAKVILTRREDETRSLSERCAIAEEAKADLFISLHSNACSDSSVRGAVAFYSLKPILESRRLCQTVLDKYCLLTGEKNMGAKFRWNSQNTDDYYGVLRGTSMPAMIMECGFHTNPQDEARLLQPEYRAIIALALHLGISHYYKKR